MRVGRGLPFKDRVETSSTTRTQTEDTLCWTVMSKTSTPTSAMAKLTPRPSALARCCRHLRPVDLRTVLEADADAVDCSGQRQ